MPNLPDTDARTLALRMFYIEVSNGMSAGDAEINVSQMFMVSPITVWRWVTLWENTGEEAFHDGRSSKEQSDSSIVLSCPDFVFELGSWIKDRIAQGGKNEDGYTAKPLSGDGLQRCPVTFDQDGLPRKFHGNV